MTTIVCELRDQLSIAVANIEAFVDGKLEPTSRRLRAVSEALSAVEVLVDRLSADGTYPRETPDGVHTESVGSP